MACDLVIELNEFINDKLSSIEIEYEGNKNIDVKNMLTSFKDTLTTILSMVHELDLDSDDSDDSSDGSLSVNDENEEITDGILEEVEYEEITD
jgi:hypothetical protein